MVSCQPVAVSSDTPGRPQRLVSTRPTAIDAAPASPATIPIGSRWAAEVSTARATPTAPIKPAITVRPEARSDSNSADNPATSSGCTAPSTAAIPPGSRYALANSSAKKNPMLSAPSAADFHHHAPRGSSRVTASSSNPAGSARSTPLSSGRSAGRNSVVIA